VNHDAGGIARDAANYCPVPFVMSTDGYAIFFHTPMATTWDMGESAPSRYEFRAAEDELDYYLFLGPSFRSMLAAYTDLTGRTPLLPKAAYGVNVGTYSGGTWGHEEDAGQRYVVSLVRRFRDEGIPIDALHLDSTRRKFGTPGGRNATSFEWRQPGFTDPPAMFQALRGLNLGLTGLHVRPLVLEYPADTLVHAIDDEYLFGDALLVAPITTAGATGRAIFLPPGEWIDYWSRERHAGNRTMQYAAAPDVLPVFVKAGAIIPMQPAMGYVGEKPAGRFAVAPRGYEFRVRLDRAPRAVRLDGTATPAWSFDAATRTLIVTTDPAKKALAVQVEIER
jgi:alpha-glucosidase (family GH31 glycosyl hydrolase)